jgi:hypothetical protein
MAIMNEQRAQTGGEAGSETQIDTNPEGMFCPLCRMEYRPGFTVCSDCKVPLVSELPPSVPPVIDEIKPNPLEGLKCQQHPAVDAVARCGVCSSGVCATCDFLIASIHVCPKCIDSAYEEKLSPHRRHLAIGAIILAIYCTLLSVFTLTGMLYRLMGNTLESPVYGYFVMFLVYLPSAVGTVLAFCAYERRLINTNLIWAALVWNSSLTTLLILSEIAFRILT